MGNAFLNKGVCQNQLGITFFATYTRAATISVNFFNCDKRAWGSNDPAGSSSLKYILNCFSFKFAYHKS